MRTALLSSIAVVVLLLSSCREEPKPDEPVIVALPKDMDAEVSKGLQSLLAVAGENDGRITDSLIVRYEGMLVKFYQSNGFKSVWSSAEVKKPLADSLLNFIRNSRDFGLFPNDYHLSSLQTLHEGLLNDSIWKHNARVWTRLELLSTDAFFHLLRDLKEGRITPDSLSIAYKKEFEDSFFIPQLNRLLEDQQLTETLKKAEPSFFKYRALRAALPAFVAAMNPVQYPQIVYPFEDSMTFVKELFDRLVAEGFAEPQDSIPGIQTFTRSVKTYQAANGLSADGKPGPATIRKLNHTDEQKFRSIAISLDKYKMLGPMPETFVWVNIPSFHLQVIIDDSMALDSRIIVGKPATPTPELKSNINNLVVYPKWTIPASIIKKEILPALKKDPDYLARKGYDLFNEKGEIINPYGINWARYSSGIPWRVVQGSGDDNALGVFKFNFNNPYSVYLHDTNQRYLFANSDRALSHGCVRVQKWRELASIIAHRDSVLATPTRLSYSQDSLQSWVANGVRKSVLVRNRFPLFIVYCTAEAEDGDIRFYTDIYNEDTALFEKYFAKN